jgi:hypothetical protein
MLACKAGLCAVACSELLQASHPDFTHLQKPIYMQSSSIKAMQSVCTPVHAATVHLPSRRYSRAEDTANNLSVLQTTRGVGQLLRNDNNTIAVGGHRG